METWIFCRPFVFNSSFLNLEIPTWGFQIFSIFPFFQISSGLFKKWLMMKVLLWNSIDVLSATPTAQMICAIAIKLLPVTSARMDFFAKKMSLARRKPRTLAKNRTAVEIIVTKMNAAATRAHPRAAAAVLMLTWRSFRSITQLHSGNACSPAAAKKSPNASSKSMSAHAILIAKFSMRTPHFTSAQIARNAALFSSLLIQSFSGSTFTMTSPNKQSLQWCSVLRTNARQTSTLIR